MFEVGQKVRVTVANQLSITDFGSEGVITILLGNGSYGVLFHKLTGIIERSDTVFPIEERHIELLNDRYNIIKFKTLTELVAEFPDLHFYGDGSLSNTKEFFSGNVNSDMLKYLGTTEQLHVGKVEEIPSWVISKNLGQ